MSALGVEFTAIIVSLLIIVPTIYVYRVNKKKSDELKIAEAEIIRLRELQQLPNGEAISLRNQLIVSEKSADLLGEVIATKDREINELKELVISVKKKLSTQTALAHRLEKTIAESDIRCNELQRIVIAAEQSASDSLLERNKLERKIEYKNEEIERLKFLSKSPKAVPLEANEESLQQQTELKSNSIPSKNRCFSCKGEGQFISGRVCSICNGVGVRPEIQAQEKKVKFEKLNPGKKYTPPTTAYTTYDFDDDWDIIANAESYSEDNQMLDQESYEYSAEMGHDGDDF
ncbi:hypothetical protein JCM19233_2595 [Vibrio astriarenae]|nr:hypothetical protein JCM19233_2595 [Vibrio sp. C7]